MYAIDARNHGNSEHVDHMSYKLMSRDMVGFCQEHGLKQATLLGKMNSNTHYSQYYLMGQSLSGRVWPASETTISIPIVYQMAFHTPRCMFKFAA